jgi:hypothetical protein
MNLNVIPPKKSSKKDLVDAAERYKQAIESQIIDIKTEAIDVGKKTLIVSGVCLSVFVLIENLLLSDDDDKPKKKKQLLVPNTNESSGIAIPKTKNSSIVLNAVKGILLTFLLSLAKDKLTQAMAHLSQADAESNSK